MVMKDNFKRDYVENLVSRILQDIPSDKGESHLLKFCALLNKYEPDASIPVSCLDAIMGGTYLKRKSKTHKQDTQELWENHVSDSAQMLLLKVHIIHVGGVFGMKIVHPIVADEVLKQTKEIHNKTTADIAVEYIQSELFKGSQHSKEYLVHKTHDMLIRRKKVEFGDEQDSEFSELIESLCEDARTEEACRVLECSFNVLKEAMIGQQLARLYYIRMKTFDKAHKYADEAINLLPTNSYLLDTKGQIYKHEIKYKYEEKYCGGLNVLGMEETHAVIQLAFQGISYFRKAQEANLTEKNSENIAGFVGEADITFLLLRILQSVELFRGLGGSELLRSYLATDIEPEQLGQWAQYHRQFKELQGRIERAIDWISDYVTYCKVGLYEYVPQGFSKVDRVKSRLEHLDKQFARYFGEPKELPCDEKDRVVENANDWRRRQVLHLGGNTFHKVFDIAKVVSQTNMQQLLKIRRLLSLNYPQSASDLQTLICVNLALSPFRKWAVQLPSLKDVIDMAKTLHNFREYDKLYAPYFLSMFLWPRESSQENDIKGFLEYADALRTRWDAMQKQNDDYPLQSYSYRRALRMKPRKRKPLTYFFLGNGKGLAAFVHNNELHTSAGKVENERQQFWESDIVTKRLVRIEGMLKNSVTAIVKVSDAGKPVMISVRLAVPQLHIVSQEPVSFYLGFSWSGPTAFYVMSRDQQSMAMGGYTVQGESVMQKRLSPREIGDRHGDYSTMQFDYESYRKNHLKLERKLREIEELENRQRQGKPLESQQVAKLKKKDDITKELMELEDSYKRQMYADDDIYH
ncbi:sterile alpha motif domain-containing protein 9-like [Ptychodera flava]|uniref:sterile alpha motif domain-containing protein 9-like n=1 Tax=Ptychodera flava TaxID=63121 RepID=UPI00396A2E05